MLNPLSLIVGWKGYVAAALASGLVCGVGVYKIMHNANLADQAKAAAVTTRLVVHQGEINTGLSTIYIPQFIFIETETAKRVAEIPKHVTPEIDRTYPVPLGFVRVWNDATHGPVPGPAAGSDADPSGVPLSDVARAHTEDQGTLDLCRKQIDEWWSWYDQNKAAWPK